MFRHLQATITGWPGGKPAHAKQPGDRPSPRDEIFPKRVLVFSPHPDDDVISMGGTLIRLVDQGHEVHVAYQTSGNIAVFDDDAIRLCRVRGRVQPAVRRLAASGRPNSRPMSKSFCARSRPGQIDSAEVQRIKTLDPPRRGPGGRPLLRLPAERLHFLDMPFYETGRVKKKPLSEEDIQLMVDLLREVRPHQIYAAGDLRIRTARIAPASAAVTAACGAV